VFEHQRRHPEAGGIPPWSYYLDVYDRWTLEKLAEDVPLPGLIVDVHEDLLWVLTNTPLPSLPEGRGVSRGFVWNSERLRLADSANPVSSPTVNASLRGMCTTRPPMYSERRDETAELPHLPGSVSLQHPFRRASGGAGVCGAGAGGGAGGGGG